MKKVTLQITYRLCVPGSKTLSIGQAITDYIHSVNVRAAKVLFTNQ